MLIPNNLFLLSCPSMVSIYQYYILACVIANFQTIQKLLSDCKYDLFHQNQTLDVFNDVLADLNLDTIPVEVQQFAETNLRETDDVKSKTVPELKALISQNTEITPLRTDDEFLLRFLRARSYDVKEAFQLFLRYHVFREENRSYFQNVNPIDLAYIAESGILSAMPYHTQNGERILIFRLGCWNPKEVKIDEIFKAALLTLEFGVLEPMTQIAGGIVIFDLQGFDRFHAYQINLSVARKILALAGLSFPIRTRAVHLVNPTKVFNVAYNIIVSIIPNKYKELLHNHGRNYTRLHNHISPKYLPKRYGGLRPDYSYRDWLINLSKNQRIISEIKNLGYAYHENTARLFVENVLS